MVLNKNFILDLFTTIMVVNVVYNLLLNLIYIFGLWWTMVVYNVVIVYFMYKKIKNEQI